MGLRERPQIDRLVALAEGGEVDLPESFLASPRRDYWRPGHPGEPHWGSFNRSEIIYAVAYFVTGEQRFVDFFTWTATGQLEGDLGFMVTETMSPIYAGWHVAFWSLVAAGAEKHGHRDLLALVRRWLRLFWSIVQMTVVTTGVDIAKKDSHFCGFAGQRSLASPDRSPAAFINWRVFRDTVFDGVMQPGSAWWPDRALIAMYRRFKNAAFRAWPYGGRPLRAEKKTRFRPGYHIVRTEYGQAVWMDRTVNGNKAPTMAVVVEDGKGTIVHPYPTTSKKLAPNGPAVCREENGVLITTTERGGEEHRVPLPRGRRTFEFHAEPM